MTSFDSHRCQHCHRLYMYQTSGWPEWPVENPDLNDGQHCPTCYQAILEALAKVPVLFEKGWAETSEATIEQLERWRDEGVAEIKARGGIPAYRVAMPLFDLSDGHKLGVEHNGIVRGQGQLAGKSYRFSWWSKQGRDKGTVWVEVWRDTTTGAATPMMYGK